MAGQAQCELLKLDCEGAEYPILMEASKDTLKRISRIVLEYHNFPDTPGHIALADYLANNGYKVTSKVNAAHSYIGYMYAERLEVI